MDKDAIMLQVSQVDWMQLRGIGCDGIRVRNALLALTSPDPERVGLAIDDLRTFAFYGGQASPAGAAVVWCLLEALKASNERASFEVLEVLYEAAVSTESAGETTLPNGRTGPSSDLCGTILCEQQSVFVDCIKATNIKIRRAALEIIDTLRGRGFDTQPFILAVHTTTHLSPEARNEFEWFRTGGFDTTEDYPGDPDIKWRPRDPT
jgi:hypothetical protein